MQIESIPAAMISSGHDARPLVEKRVAALAESIRDIGLINPVIVRRALKIRNGVDVEAWEILAGHHRFAACRKHLRWEEIPCVVREASDLQSELVAIDENLCREELSPAQAAYQTSRRKELYEILHSETRQHVAGAHAANRLQGNAAAKLAVAFTSDTVSRTGRAERTVRRDAARGETLGVDLNRVAGALARQGRQDPGPQPSQHDAALRPPPRQSAQDCGGPDGSEDRGGDAAVAAHGAGRR